jgi:hypothetical protein
MDLVVRLDVDANGKWCVAIDGTHMLQAIPLVPVTLIVHVWRASDAKILRGSIELHGSRHIVVMQSNAELLDLIHAWLLSADKASER